MLRFGVIGYGGRIRGVIGLMRDFGVPFEIAALADPRGDELKAQCDELKDCAVYTDADEMLDATELDGALIGTRCSLHTPMACKVAARNLPLFLEKPVATSMEQVHALSEAYEKATAEVVVSFPLRLTPLVQTAKEIIASGRLGTIEHVQAWNNVPYGDCYYGAWYRDYNETGGLFLQKATHDFDYISYLLDQRPKWVAAMNSQRIYGGDKPETLTCDECGEQQECIESPFNLYYRRCETPKVQPSGKMCMFAESIRNEDSGNAMLEFENGVQASYSQNFFARRGAGARGARLFGYDGTIEFDWYTGEIKVFMHHTPRVETIRFDNAMQSHGGGDTELAYDFLNIVRGVGHSRSPIEAGIMSALTCLKARESAQTRQFCEVVM
jgi:predicted dehydrogenase